MRIAILGATSQIARDLICSFSVHDKHQLVLFARRPEVVEKWLCDAGLAKQHSVCEFERLSREDHFDALINFVGVGNPAQALALGASIFEITHQFDQLAVDYLQRNENCRYIFLSSGAAYGSTFMTPADRDTQAVFPLNNLQAQDWYGLSKLYAESRHRALKHLAITDIRVFNYFSRSQDISARFLISDILRTIQEDSVLVTSPDPIVRDFLHPLDFHQMVVRILTAPANNMVLDCYSRAPIGKADLLIFMSERFGLRYVIADPAVVNATGSKLNYYSNNKQAHALGYAPLFSSLEGLEKEATWILQR